MSNNSSLPCRKSKRVAKRQEDEYFWLMHNFPQGIHYDDLCNDPTLNNKSSPPSVKTKEFLTSINDKLKDDSSTNVAIKMPRFLRSGKRISQEVQSFSDGAGSTDLHSDTPPHSPLKNHIDPPVGHSPTVNSNIILCTNLTTADDTDVEGGLSTEISDELEPPEQLFRTTRSRSLGNSATFIKPTTKKRNSAPLKPPKKAIVEEDDDLTPEEKAQIRKIEQSKLPKFQAAPNKICTRSGATYAFAWKSYNSKERSSPVPTTEQSKVSEELHLHCDRVTRGSFKKIQPSPDTETCAIQEKAPAVAVPKMEVVQVKVELKDPDIRDIKPSIKKIKIMSTSNVQYPAFLFPSSDGEMTDSAHPLLPTINVAKKRKRKRLSLLPTQKEDDLNDDFSTATWLDVLNRNHAKSPSSRNSPSCSRSESPISPASSVSSENVAVTPKRIGRTASLNCRAVLSALMRPEPHLKKGFRKSPPKIISSPKEKAIKSKGQPESFFNIKVNASYTQKIEFIQNGGSSTSANSPMSLRAHEARILANIDKVRITTNGWQWIGSCVNWCSFYREPNLKTTRLYFSAMQRDGVELRVGDSVALQTSDTLNKPFVGKIISMWQDNLGEMMVTMCWFYRPSDLENIKSPYGVNELYLSKHTDDNSVATIQDKVFVLSFPEYCRYYSHLAEKKQPTGRQDIVPNVCKWRDGTIPDTIQKDCIYFCRGVYDFRLRRTLKQQLYYTKYL